MRRNFRFRQPIESPKPVAPAPQGAPAAISNLYAKAGRFDPSAMQPLDVELNTEEYRPFEENPFLRPAAAGHEEG